MTGVERTWVEEDSMGLDVYGDVVVVGGGPAGLSCATELARCGFTTLLLEEHASVAEKVLCTGIIGIDAFQEFPLPRESIVGMLNPMKAVSSHGTELPYTPPRPMAYIVDKGAFNQGLAARATAAGARLLTSTRAQRLEVDEGQVRLHATAPEGHGLTVHAAVAVLACGVNYQLTKHVGLGAPREFLQGAQAEVPWVWTAGTEVLLDKTVSPEAFAWVVPLQNGRTRVGVMRAHDARGALMQVLDRTVPQWRERPDIHLASKPIAQTPLRRSYAERILVIGEAAGQVKATTGGGIYYGLLAARLAADTIRTAFATGCFTADTMRSYERRWKALLAEELAVGFAFRKLYGWLNDRQVDGLLHYIARHGLKDLIRQKAHFDWHRELITELGRSLPLGKLCMNMLFGL
jgi:digeranylgeranylglycerophospholipid reductase